MERCSTGSFWRVKASAVGPSWREMAAAHDAAVSVASAGRHTSMCGMQRSAQSCSMGWWVGPSSPRKMESCVKTKVLCSRDSAASRMGGRM